MLARRVLSALARRASSSRSLGDTRNGIVADSFARGRRERSDDATETANDTQDASDVEAVVRGGGVSGQSGAIRLAISRALLKWDPDFRPALKSAGLLTRDPRMVERKKPGLKKARKAKQWVKR